MSGENKDNLPEAQVVRTPEQWIAEAVISVSKPEKVEISLEQLKKTYGGLVIKDATDRPGYLAVVEGAKIAKKFRTGIEAKRKLMLAFPKKYTDEVNAEAKRITGEVSVIEENLLKKQKDYEDVEAAAAQKELLERTQKLLDAGFKFDGTAYVCGVHVIPATKIPELEVEKVEYYIAEAVKLVEAEKQAEVNRQALAAANTEEAKRLAQERVDLDNKKKALDEQMATMAKMMEDMKALQNPTPPAPVVETVKEEAQAFPTFPSTIETAKPEGNTQPGADALTGFGNTVYTTQAPGSDILDTQDKLDEYIADSGKSAEYIDGFEHCRQAVLDIFKDQTPKKRADFMAEISALKP